MKLRIKRNIKENYPFVLIAFLAFLIMVLVSYYYVSRILEKQMLTIGEETMNTTQESVSAGLSEVEIVYANMTQYINLKLVNGETNKDILEFLTMVSDEYLKDDSIIPDFLSAYGYIRGEFLVGIDWVPPKEYDPTSRPWYIGAKEKHGEIFLTEPYLDANTGDIIISFSQELFDNKGNSYGVATMDFKLTRIAGYITSQEISKNGYGVMIDNNKSFTTHRDSSLIGIKMTDAGGDYKTLSEMLGEKDLSAVRFTDADGTDSLAFFRSIFHGWHIGIIIPRDKYFSQGYELALVLGSLGLILTVVLSYLLIRFHNEKMRSDEESKSKSSFLAMMSHEMRTPMNAIIGMINITKKTKDLEIVYKNIDKINDSANHLLGVINDVLDISKIEAGKMELCNTEFWFEDIIKQVSTVMNFKFDEKNQNFNIDIDENVPKSIIADKQRLAQVIANLLSNANKFTENNGNIDLIVRKIEDVEDKCRLQIEVRDDGIGISEEQQKQLFHSFKQADNSISRKYGGTGLGLTISKRIINMMNGDIWIESKPGDGAKFIFNIIVGVGSIAESECEEEVSLEEENISNIFVGKRILLAEDVDINREIIIELLKETGVTVDSGENGHVVCEMFMSNPEIYDMIFMDLQMPEMDGYEATKKIREMDNTKAKSIPIIAMTANVFKEDIEKCLSVGMNDHIGKPVDINTVISKMKRYMQ